jgi:hypothetical protein
MRRIEIIVRPDGTLSIDVDGVEDMSCLDLTADLINSLGVEVSVDEKPQDFSELDGTYIHLCNE